MKIYVIRNKEGKFFKPVGMGGAGKSQWQDKLEKANFYPKIGPARARATYFNKHDKEVCILEFEIMPENAKKVE